MNPTPIDLLIDNGTVFTLDPQRRVLESASVAVSAGRIVAVGDATELRARYTPRQTINAHRKAVLPGLIDAHFHTGQQLLRAKLPPQAIMTGRRVLAGTHPLCGALANKFQYFRGTAPIGLTGAFQM